MRVTIQYAEKRRPYKHKTAFTGRVLYADRNRILLISGGVHNLFHTSDGRSDGIGWKFDHPEAKRLPRRPGPFFLHPKSLAAIKAILKADKEGGY